MNRDKTTGRYGSPSDEKPREPVAVTCDECGAATTGHLCFYTRRVDSGRRYMGLVIYDDEPVTLCSRCGPRLASPSWTAREGRRCLWCDRPFTWTGYRGRRYCTAECAVVAGLARRRHSAERSRAKVCGQCRRGFMSTRADGNYCSPACRQRAYRRRLALKAAKRAADAEMIRSINESLGGVR